MCLGVSDSKTSVLGERDWGKGKKGRKRQEAGKGAGNGGVRGRDRNHCLSLWKRHLEGKEGRAGPWNSRLLTARVAKFSKCQYRIPT